MNDGGQTKYVFEFTDHLFKHPLVEHVHIFTQLIQEKELSPDYAISIEELNLKLDIRRIPFGSKKYKLQGAVVGLIRRFCYRSH